MEKYQLLIFLLTKWYAKGPEEKINQLKLADFFAEEIGNLKHEIVFIGRNGTETLQYRWLKWFNYTPNSKAFFNGLLKPLFTDEAIPLKMTTKCLISLLKSIDPHILGIKEWSREDIKRIHSTLITPFQVQELTKLARQFMAKNKFGIESLLSWVDKRLLELEISTQALEEVITTRDMKIDIEGFNSDLRWWLNKGHNYNIIQFLCAFPHKDSFSILKPLKKKPYFQQIIESFIVIHTAKNTHYGDVKDFINIFSEKESEEQGKG